MRKKFLAAVLAATMTMTMFAGCGDKSGSSTSPTPSTGGQTQTGGDETSGGSEGSGSGNELLTVEIFDVAANFQGVQSGWFGKIVKDKFNMELNIISPQVSGDAIFQTRASTGNLGDIVLLDAIQFNECVDAGLIRSIDDKIGDCKNLMDYKKQIDTLNNGIPGNSDKKTYGIPTEMTNTSPTSVSQDVVYSSPLLRWDLYKQIGSPDIADLDGLLDALEAIHEVHPTNESGDPAYPLSLWPDWDGNDGMIGIANVVQLTTWYGEKIKGSVILRPDDTFTPLTDSNASYYKITKFLNNAYRRGLVDPDSGTQDWNAACAKMAAGQVDLMWYSWQVGFWNSLDKLQDGSAFIFIPVKDQKYYSDSDTYYGSGRVFGVGSGVEGEKYDRIMEFLDWYASPEGLVIQHAGIEGFTYEVVNGKYKAINTNALMDNLPVPEEYGGGGYNDGFNAINQWIVASISKNPLTGESYNTQYWSSYKEETMTEMKKEWQEKFGAAEPVEYMQKNNALVVSPNVSVALPADTNEIGLIRESCNKGLCDYTWKMIFAKDDATFDNLWYEMCTYLDGYGYQDLVKFDMEKHQIEVDAKKAAK